MLSVKKFRELNGQYAQGLSDDEIQAIIDTQYALTQIIYEQWQIDRQNKLAEHG